MNGCTRVRIVNDITGHTTTLETPRPHGAVLFELVKLMRGVNRQKDDVLRAALCLTADLITLHWYTPTSSERGTELNAELLSLGEPIREVERILWVKGGQT